MPRLFAEMGKFAMGNTVHLLGCVRFEMSERRCHKGNLNTNLGLGSGFWL